MSRLAICLLAIAPLLTTAALQAAPPRQPNIVLLLADDLGYADLGCYGHPYARTPHLDRLAREGTRFENFHVTGVTCCPSRTGFMTSQWPASFAHYPADGGFGDRPTVTQLLKEAGYATGHFGKWHIGPEMKPGTYGIDVTASAELAHTRRGANSPGRDSAIYDAAIRFVEANHDRPFYMNVWGHITHHPVNPPQAYADRFKDVVVKESDFAPTMREKFATVKARGDAINQAMRNYLGELSSLDDDIGRLLKRIDDLGLAENTIVVFSSDQGSPSPPPPGQEREAKKKRAKNKAAAETAESIAVRSNLMGYNGIYRGGKHGMYEGGVRAPFIIRWPGHVPAGRVDKDSLLSGIDWLPTLCSLAGVKIDATKFEGQDASRAWLGDKFARTKPLLWKTSAPNSPAGIREGQWKLMQGARRRGELELYDLATDPSETKNVAAQNPDIAARLAAKLAAWTDTLPKEYIKSGRTDD